eukprot:UN34361
MRVVSNCEPTGVLKYNQFWNVRVVCIINAVQSLRSQIALKIYKLNLIVIPPLTNDEFNVTGHNPNEPNMMLTPKSGSKKVLMKNDSYDFDDEGIMNQFRSDSETEKAAE